MSERTPMELTLLLLMPLWTPLPLPLWTTLLLLLPPALLPLPCLCSRLRRHCSLSLARSCLLLACRAGCWRLPAAADCCCGLRCLCWGLMRAAQHTLFQIPPPLFPSSLTRALPSPIAVALSSFPSLPARSRVALRCVA